MTKHCEWCKKVFPVKEKYMMKVARFCGKSCSAKWRMGRPWFVKSMLTKERSERLSKAIKLAYEKNPGYAVLSSERMKKNNPMRMPGIREKVSKILKKMGHQPKIRGGNGTGPTRPEKILWEKFPDLSWNYPIKLGLARQPGYPSCYKADLCYPDLKLAIEVDGTSHQMLARQMQDKKKDAKLKELGWLVLRILNKEILGNTDLTVE